MNKKFQGAMCLCAPLFLAPSLHAATPAVLDFGYSHGTVLATQYLNTTVGDFDYGITISATGGPNTAIVYDSEVGNNLLDGTDPDLERVVNGSPGGDNISGGWDGGNALDSNGFFNAGGLLIVQENAVGISNNSFDAGVTSASGFIPDDRAGQGTDSLLTFNIEDGFAYNTFQLTLADFEEAATGFQVTVYGFDGNGGVAATPFLDFALEDLVVLDGTIESGNNFINILPSLDELDNFTGENIAQLEINFGTSSGAISNIVFAEIAPVPEPSSSLLFSLGLSSLLLRRKRG